MTSIPVMKYAKEQSSGHMTSALNMKNDLALHVLATIYSLYVWKHLVAKRLLLTVVPLASVCIRIACALVRGCERPYGFRLALLTVTEMKDSVGWLRAAHAFAVQTERVCLEIAPVVSSLILLFFKEYRKWGCLVAGFQLYCWGAWHDYCLGATQRADPMTVVLRSCGRRLSSSWPPPRGTGACAEASPLRCGMCGRLPIVLERDHPTSDGSLCAKCKGKCVLYWPSFLFCIAFFACDLPRQPGWGRCHNGL